MKDGGEEEDDVLVAVSHLKKVGTVDRGGSRTGGAERWKAHSSFTAERAPHGVSSGQSG